MTRILLFFVLSVWVSAAQAGSGIDFRTGDLDAAVVQAEEEDKLLLLDFTASWCMPCKKMDREVFPDADLGALVHDLFVPFRVNADYFWGLDIARSFEVRAYPTLLVIDPEKRVVKRITGFRTAEKLIAELEPLRDLDSLWNGEANR